MKIFIFHATHEKPTTHLPTQKSTNSKIFTQQSKNFENEQSHKNQTENRNATTLGNRVCVTSEEIGSRGYRKKKCVHSVGQSSGRPTTISISF